MRRLLAAGLVLAMIGLGCGGGDSGTDPNPPTVTVTVTPPRDTLTVGTATTFTAAVANSGNTGVSWTVIGGAANGTISPAGLFTAAGTPGNVSVVATSDAAPTAKDTAVVQVVAAPNVTITASDSVPEAQAGLVASVPAQAGATYAWTVTGGTITAGQGSAGIAYTSATPGTATVGVTVTNLADSAVTGSRNVTVVAAPVITSFTASRDTVTNGESTSLVAVFTGGAGSVNQGVGTVTSGIAAPTAPLGAPNVPVTYTLTVTGPLNVTRTAQVSAVAVNPPFLFSFRAVTSRAPVGGEGILELQWTADPGVVASIAPGIGTVMTEVVASTGLASPGPTLFTASVRSPADSVITDTATILAVTPAAGGFSPTGSLNIARFGAAMTELQDGRVLVAGGHDWQSGPTQAELYDPATGQFTPTGSLHAPRQGASGVRLPDGRVLVAGFGDGLDSLTDIYDPALGQFTAGPKTKLPSVVKLFQLQDNRVVAVTGGFAMAFEVYDAVSDSFAIADTLAVRRAGAGIVKLLDDRILVAGGSVGGVGQVVTAEIFDPSAGTVGPTGSMLTPRADASYIVLADGRVLAVGGVDVTGGGWLATAEVYDPAAGTWSPVGTLAQPLAGATLVLLPDNRVLVAGGVSESRAVTFAETFDPATGQFTPLVGNLGGARARPMALRLSDGRVLLVGGDSTTQAATPSAMAELFQ